VVSDYDVIAKANTTDSSACGRWVGVFVR